MQLFHWSVVVICTHAVVPCFPDPAIIYNLNKLIVILKGRSHYAHIRAAAGTRGFVRNVNGATTFTVSSIKAKFHETSFLYVTSP